MIKVNIQGVQATMLIPLRGRTVFSQRFPDLYDNENDRKICERLDFDFSQLDRVLGEYGNLCYIARARAAEHAIKEYISRFPAATIVNIGSGLDTIFQQVDNGSIRWYNLDLPDAMTFRNQLITEPDRSFCIAKSVFDLSWFEDIRYDEEKGFLMIAAGVFHFLPPEELKILFAAIADHFPAAELFFDVNSTVGNEYSNRSMKASGNEDALLRFAIDDPQELEGWSDQIKLLSCTPYFKDIPRYSELEEITRQYMDMADTQGMSKYIRLYFGSRI